MPCLRTSTESPLHLPSKEEVGLAATIRLLACWPKISVGSGCGCTKYESSVNYLVAFCGPNGEGHPRDCIVKCVVAKATQSSYKEAEGTCSPPSTPYLSSSIANINLLSIRCWGSAFTAFGSTVTTVLRRESLLLSIHLTHIYLLKAFSFDLGIAPQPVPFYSQPLPTAHRPGAI